MQSYLQAGSEAEAPNEIKGKFSMENERKIFHVVHALSDANCSKLRLFFSTKFFHYYFILLLVIASKKIIVLIDKFISMYVYIYL